jgi:ATP-binding cassette subfamily F protein 3
VLALLAWQAPNVLLLDEPTNHLDLDMRHALTTALQGFEGAVITVSHDRHLLQSTVDSYLLVAGGRITPFDGDLGDYKAWLDQRSRSGAADASGGSGDTAQRNAASDTKTSDAKKAALQQTDRKAARQAAARERAAVAPLRKKSSSLIRAIDDKSDELKRVDTQIADPELYRSENRSKLEPLLKRQAALREEIATLESEWVEVEARIEAG